MKFAGFIMTYERPNVIVDTITKIFSQTLPPEKLLVVDSSATDATRLVIQSLNDRRVEYFAVGYNAGPAGASKIGLQKLSEQGYEWIYWCDDDDPPKFPDTLEQVLKCKNHGADVGILGAVGSRFNWKTGMLERLHDHELKGIIEVDVVAGGMTMIVNSSLVKSGVVPDEKLFFSFEDLDFCIRAKAAGYKIVVNGDMALRYRTDAGRLNLGGSRDKYKGWKFDKSRSSLWREYYSVRNFIYMMGHKFRKPKVVLILLARVFYKVLFGFKIYKGNGFLNMRIMAHAVRDGFLNRLGRNDKIIRLIKP